LSKVDGYTINITSSL